VFPCLWLYLIHGSGKIATAPSTAKNGTKMFSCSRTFQNVMRKCGNFCEISQNFFVFAKMFAKISSTSRLFSNFELDFKSNNSSYTDFDIILKAVKNVLCVT
jgi:hypothetical protein